MPSRTCTSYTAFTPGRSRSVADRIRGSVMAPSSRRVTGSRARRLQRGWDNAVMTVVPDTKDWTWVLDRACPECGFVAAAATVHSIAGAVRANAATWEAVLTLDDAAARPAPGVWSPL